MQEVGADHRTLERTFARAVAAHNEGLDEEALKLFKQVLALEPRLPEPRLEVALILLRCGELEEADAQAREALAHLEKGWRALDTLSDDQLMAHGCNLLAEIIKERIATGEILHADPGILRKLWREAEQLVERAARLDPDNQDIMHNYFGFRGSRDRGPAG